MQLSTPLAALTIARVCRIWTGSAPASLVDDILQELFLKLCEQERRILREFRPRSQDSFFALLRTVSASVANDYFRRSYSLKRGGRTFTSSLDEHPEEMAAARLVPSPMQSVLHEQLDQMMRSAPKIVSERDRSLFWLYYLQGFTADELASMDGANLTAKGVESALRRVSAWLKKEIGQRRQETFFHAPGPETTS